MIQNLYLITLAIILLFILVKSAGFVEDGFHFISKKLKINEFFLGFGILGLITSLPEISIAFSSHDEAPELSLGNLIGATIVLMTLIIGLFIFKFKEISFKKIFTEGELILSLITIFASIVLISDGHVEFRDGVMLSGIYLMYLIHLWNKYGAYPKNLKSINISAQTTLKIIVKVTAGIFLLLFCSSLLVDTVIELGNNLHIEESIIGLFVLAIGTNIPELSMLTAMKNGSTEDDKQLVIGNLIGSATANTGILGLLGLLSMGFKINDFGNFLPAIIILAITICMFAVFGWTGRKIDRTEACILVLIYVSFIVTEVVRLFI